MKRRVAIITEIIAPYRTPVFNALAQDPEVDPFVIFLSETDPSLRQWKIYRDEIRFGHTVLPSWRRRIGKYNVLLNRGLRTSLHQFRPHAIVCGGYSYLSSWNAVEWAHRNQVPTLLWSESTLYDRRSHRGIVELLKGEFIRRCDGFVVPGESSRRYLRSFGIHDSAIITAPNAVDNGLFSRETQPRLNGSGPHRKLPARFFLYVGRLVTEKGIFELLDAYAKLDLSLRSTVGLVFAGDGDKKEALMRQSSQISPASIHCLGFVQRDELAGLYARAEAFVLPTHSDPWGLVVNEAMASGLPVITTAVAGCAADLVEDQETGFVVQPGDVEGLCSAMSRLASDSSLRQRMSSRSQQRIQAYSPDACASGLADAVQSVCQARP